MKNKKKDLPVKSNKLKRAIWLFLASIGIGSSIPNSTYAKEQETTIQNTNTLDKNNENTRSNFLNEMKVDIPTQGAIDYKELSLNIIKEKGFDTVHSRNEYAQEQISELFDVIRKNAPRLGSLYGIEDTSAYTTNLENMIYSQLSELNDLVFSRSEDNDKYTQQLLLNQEKNDLDFIAGIYIPSEDFIIIKDDINRKRYNYYGIILHELEHHLQENKVSSDIALPNYKKIHYFLKERRLC